MVSALSHLHLHHLVTKDLITIGLDEVCCVLEAVDIWYISCCLNGGGDGMPFFKELFFSPAEAQCCQSPSLFSVCTTGIWNECPVVL